MFKVAIVAALEREVRRLIRVWHLRSTEHPGCSLRFFEEEDVVLVCGGIGAQAARRAAESVIEIYAPTVIYSVGFAGALEPGLKAGDIVQPSVVIDAGDGSRVILNEGRGILVSFASVANPEQKAKLRESFGAQAVDMEAAAVARAAQVHRVEFAAVKAISDEVDFAFPEMERFIDSDGQFRQGRFVRHIAVRPWLWPTVNRLAGNSDKAAAALCDWLIPSLNRMIATAPASGPEAMRR